VVELTGFFFSLPGTCLLPPLPSWPSKFRSESPRFRDVNEFFSWTYLCWDTGARLFGVFLTLFSATRLVEGKKRMFRV